MVALSEITYCLFSVAFLSNFFKSKKEPTKNFSCEQKCATFCIFHRIFRNKAEFFGNEESKSKFFAKKLTMVNTAARASFLYHNFGQQGQARFEFFCDPTDQIFTRRILQSWNVVEQAMIEHLVNTTRKSLADFCKVHNPARGWIHFPLNTNLDTKRMAM
jgi:hypothetical protein